MERIRLTASVQQGSQAFALGEGLLTSPKVRRARRRSPDLADSLTSGLLLAFRLGFSVEPLMRHRGNTRFDPREFCGFSAPGWRGRVRCAVSARSTSGWRLKGLWPEEPHKSGARQ
jgi:hypothetical protein